MPYLPSSYLPGDPPVPGEDLITALVALFGSDPALVAALPGGLSEDEAASGAAYPYATIEDYSEAEPGETLEDHPIDLVLSIYGTDSGMAATAAKVVKGVLKPGSGRDQLAWTGEHETTNERTSGKPYVVPGRGPGGVTVWAADLGYRFWVTTEAP